MSDPEPFPRAAAILGYCGLVPFAGLAAAVVVAPDPMDAQAASVLLAYAATILSFLGGVHWGLAIAASTLTPSQRTFHLGLSVVPQLLGWSALLALFPYGFALTAMGLLSVLVIDAKAVRAKFSPRWFMALRWPLSCAAATALIIAAVGR
jgi:Protein of unknown function (DUF3429)